MNMYNFRQFQSTMHVASHTALLEGIFFYNAYVAAMWAAIRHNSELLEYLPTEQ